MSPALLLRARPGHPVTRAVFLALAITAGCFPPGDTIGLDDTEIVLTVVDEANQGIAGADVGWWPAGLEGIELNQAGTTGTTGRVTFDIGIWSEVTIELVLPDGYVPAANQANPFTITVTTNRRNNVTFRATGP